MLAKIAYMVTGGIIGVSAFVILLVILIDRKDPHDGVKK